MSRKAAPRRLALLSGVAVLSVLAGGCGGGSKPPEPGEAESTESGDAAGETSAAGTEGEESDETSTAETTLEPLPRRTVEIYFPSMSEDGLVTEHREIFTTATAGDQVKQIVNDLLSGPTSDDAGRAVPGGTRLRQVYVLADGVAWLDFTSELADGLGGGSMTELLTVYAIVDSVVANVPEVRRVGILVDGQPVATLNGHLYLSRPLRPDYSLVRGSITVEGPTPDDGTERLAEAAGPADAAAD